MLPGGAWDGLFIKFYNKVKEFCGHMTRISKIEMWRERFREYIIKTDRPSVVNFCAKNFLSKSSFYHFAKKDPDEEGLRFLAEICATKQENALVEDGLDGKANPQITKLVLATNHGYTERVESHDRAPAAYNHDPAEVVEAMKKKMEKEDERR